ncbi:hypothetical protein [Kutzneria sp. 744]|uniref:hypothetical protein n=1 Tax=Kutzneria sp. (strain 744) TaxID=345341 RepID=UPI0003EEC4D4|nr:hypothetical protein [Kutzneria sp. 744]EWM15522.1 hypothetical protein KUTG_05826 [Kutzneria sp. 744]
MAKERRRRAYLPAGIVILAVLGGGQYYLSNIFAPADTGPGGSTGSGAAGGGQPLKGEADPNFVVVSAYAAVAADEPDLVCSSVLGGIGGVSFAKDLGAANCAEAIHKASKAVTDRNAYAGVTVPQGAVHKDGTAAATVYSCAMSITGGESLGTFKVGNTANGWIVLDHQPDPPSCPPAGS